jgi:hypothetical protein
MSTKKTAPQPAISDLDSKYRPLGLKAVLAAALMLKRSPKAKTAA